MNTDSNLTADVDRRIVARDAANAAADDARGAVITEEEARTIAYGWTAPDAPGLTAFATGHANWPSLAEVAIDEIDAELTRGKRDQALNYPGATRGHTALKRVRAFLTDSLPYFVLTSSLPGYLPEGEPYVTRGVRAMRETLRDMLDHAADSAAERIPDAVLRMYEAHGVVVAIDYATSAYDYADDEMPYDDVVERLDELDELDSAITHLDRNDPADVGGVMFTCAPYAYDAEPRTRDSLAADGWVFDAEGEVDYDAMPY